ncbi:MAG: cyclic nucleotide-binding domain-containing protein [Rhizobium sp.]|nr:MAG: cyclic nucleotide-binding domain-containing protein [Rhizobium sp.]
MPHDVALIALIAAGFVFAAVFGYLADRLHLPPLVGYLVAGVIIGSSTPGFVADVSLASQLAEIGVILLMFGVGLHFSAADLLAVRGVAIPGAVGQIAIATVLGVGLTSLWGWSVGAGIVFGLSLAVASTVVLLKALEERNLVSSTNGRVAVGWLIVEDLAMVLALVLLPAFASVLGGHGDAGDHAASGSIWLTIGMTLVKVAAFAAVAIFLGPRIVPWLLTSVARTGSRELFTLSVLAIALGIAFGAAEIFGVSFALGAFFAGLVMSESHLSHRAAADSLPLQNAFSVLFFVSVGMLFDPLVLVREPLMILGVLALIMLGKSLIAFCVVLLLRYPASIGFAVAAGLAQIGEFSFILAGLGVSLGLLTREGQDLILAGAILSITLNPLAFFAVEKVEKWALARWPSFMGKYGMAKQENLRRQLTAINKQREERDRQHHLEIEQLIETFPMFAELDDNAHEELLLLFRPRSASPGDRVIRTGDRGDSMFFIASGAVEVQLEDEEIPLGAGSFFGEMALLTGARRTADVVAVDFCQLFVLDRRDFNLFMSRHPQLRAAVSRMARERQESNVSRQRRDQSLDAS